MGYFINLSYYCFIKMYSFQVIKKKGSNYRAPDKGNSEMIFLYLRKKMPCDPSLELSWQDSSTVQILCIGTDRSQQTVQTKIRLLLKKQSDQGLHCLPFHQHLWMH